MLMVPFVVLGGKAFDVATTAWVNAVVAAGGSVSAGRKTTVDNLIVGLKADGIWTKLDRLWLFAAENQTSALIDLVADSGATAVNSPTFTVDRGYTGDINVFRYINTNFNPATQGANFTLNSASYAVWDNTSRAGTLQFQIGMDDGATKNTDMLTFDSTSKLSGSLNDGSNNGFVVGGSDGLSQISRTSSTSKTMYKNGASVGSVTVTATGIPSFNFYVLAKNTNGSPGQPSDDQISMSCMGGAFTSGDASNFYSRLRTYMTAVGVP